MRKSRTPQVENDDEVAQPLIEDCFLALRRLSERTCMSVQSLRSYINSPSHPLPVYRVRGKILVSWVDFNGWIQRYRCKTPEIDKIVDDILEGFREKK
jgi:hypothetical protein